ncbi:MAG: hypothetical protein JXQ65_16275 [Candidatus Marinimicrobia bacterium]|nr:hypothetical protein [Candidatus Neomarinimicrobiota bacterium]
MRCKYTKYLLAVLLLSGLSLNAGDMEKTTLFKLEKNFRQNLWRTDDHWLAHDKLQHLTTSTFIFITHHYYQDNYTSLSFENNLYASYGISFSLGLGKEILDFRGPSKYFSLKDLTVDFAGSVLGHMIVSALR